MKLLNFGKNKKRGIRVVSTVAVFWLYEDRHLYLTLSEDFVTKCLEVSFNGIVFYVFICCCFNFV